MLADNHSVAPKAITTAIDVRHFVYKATCEDAGAIAMAGKLPRQFRAMNYFGPS
jgi:hypothetical protein